MNPPGTRIIAHDKPDSQPSWVPHGQPGWDLGPAMEDYRCHRDYIDRTRATSISDTVEFPA